MRESIETAAPTAARAQATTAVQDAPRASSSARFLALGCIGLIAASAPAFAQDQASPSNAPSGTKPEASAKVLGAVTVTDTAITDGSYKADKAASPKYTAPLLDTPRAVTVIPAQVLADTATASLTEALRLVPGITLGAGEGGNPQGDRPFIRGSDSQNSLFVDAVRDIGTQSRDTFAVESIEVVKGADSTMGGRGNVGGAINLVSKLPEDAHFAKASVALGTAAYKRATVDVNQTLGNDIAVRVAGLYHDQKVAGRDAVWQDRWGIAPSVKVGLTGPTSLTLSYYHLQGHELPDSGIPYHYTPATAPAGVTETTVADVPRGTFYGLAARDFRDTLVNTGTARIEHHFGKDLTLRNTTRYGVSSQGYVLTQPDDSQGNVANGLVWRRANTRYSRTEGLINQTDLFGSFAIGKVKNSFTVTAELSSEKVGVGAYVADPATGTALATGINATGGRCGTAAQARFNCTSLTNPNPYDPWVSYLSDGSSTLAPIQRSAEKTWTRARALTQAVSVLDTVTLSDALLLNLGGRFDRYITRVSPGLAATAADESGRVWYTRRDNLWTYQAGLTWKPRPNGSVYVSTSTAATPPGSFLANGSESNAVNVTSQALTDALKVERTRNYEIGTKWNLFGEGLSLTLAAFHAETSNARATDANGTVAFIGNKRIKGIEFTFSGNITERWNVFGGYTYMDSTIVSGGMTATTVGSTVYLAPAANNGKRFPNTPEHSFTAATTYKVSEALSVGGNAAYMGKVYGGYADLRTVSGGVLVVSKPIDRYVPAYWRFDLNAKLRLNSRVELQANINNLFDKRYYDKAYNSHFASQAAGRTAIATMNVSF
ncbi:TonB-dependent receptor [Novosphingobium sp.]|uniref:TonB-dependent receptor n=1 Tax=Novosphingobium sp. TaxID=1874826 RepID=UPI0038BD9DA0